MLSIVIPSRSDQWLQKTVDDLFNKAEGEVEVIVVYDGRWAEPILKDHPNLVQIHHGVIHDNLGMRASINAGVAVSRGKYIMKVDEHTMMSQGYDVRLSNTCEDDWLVVPRRYRLDAENWKIIEDGRNPIDYMYVSYPYRKLFDATSGLYGAEDRQRYYDRKDIEIDDLMTMQGSAWFMPKTYFNKLFPNGLDDINYGPFNHEAQELSCTVWLSGGRVVVDKGCYYTHLHKGKGGKGYAFTNEQYRKHMAYKEQARCYAMSHWLTTKDYKYDWEWLMEKFAPVPTWPENWKEQIKIDEDKDWSKLGLPTWGQKDA
jgi:glycosyltransferase involved in cell wall biosynthesis